MEKRTYNEIKNIVELYGSLELLYNTLADLEIENKVDSKEYQENIGYIKQMIEFINKKWKELNISDDEAFEAYDYLDKTLNLYDEAGDFIIDILELNDDNRYRRLAMALYYIGCENNIVTFEDLNDDEYDFVDPYDLEELKDSILEYMEEDLEKENEVNILKDKLLAHTLMDYLIDFIKQIEDPELKKELIKVKYRLIYLVKYLEEEFILSPTSFSKTKFYQELVKMNEAEDEDEYMRDYSEPIEYIVKNELEYLSKLDNVYFEDKLNSLRASLRVLYIKTYLSINFDNTVKNNIKVHLINLIKKSKSNEATKKLEETVRLKKQYTIEKNIDL